MPGSMGTVKPGTGARPQSGFFMLFSLLAETQSVLLFDLVLLQIFPNNDVLFFS